jgi:triacylglycerol esterase/lipase EstA (alpha/beta hydrolase family)
MASRARSVFWVEARAFAQQGLWMLRPGEAYREHAASRHLTVFIHGYFATCAVFQRMSEALARRGVAPRQLHFTYPPAGTVAQLAEQLDARVRAVHPEGPIHIVGHSMGGLVARWYRQILGRPVERIVFLATPHYGTQRARFYKALPLARELAPESETLRQLEATRHALEGVRTRCIVAEGDHLIAPVESALLAGHEAIRVPDVGHQSMLMDPRVIDCVAEVLAE